MPNAAFRKELGLPGLLAGTRQLFEAIPDKAGNNQIALADHLMSALAMFGLKYPSLLRFDIDSRGDEANT